LTTGQLGGGLLVVFLFAVMAVLKALVGQEAKGRVSDLSTFLIEGAVSRLPVQHRDEKREEWRAELHEMREKPLSALRFSWQIYRLRGVTAHELRVEPEAPTLQVSEKAPTPLSLDDLHPRLRAAIEGLREFGWLDVVDAMHDPTLHRVDESLFVATARFCAVIDESRQPPGGPETAELTIRLGEAIDPRLRRHYTPSGAFRR